VTERMGGPGNRYCRVPFLCLFVRYSPAPQVLRTQSQPSHTICRGGKAAGHEGLSAGSHTNQEDHIMRPAGVLCPLQSRLSISFRRTCGRKKFESIPDRRHAPLLITGSAATAAGGRYRIVEVLRLQGLSQESLHLLQDTLVPTYHRLGDVQAKAVTKRRLGRFRAPGHLDGAFRLNLRLGGAGRWRRRSAFAGWRNRRRLLCGLRLGRRLGPTRHLALVGSSLRLGQVSRRRSRRRRGSARRRTPGGFLPRRSLSGVGVWGEPDGNGADPDHMFDLLPGLPHTLPRSESHPCRSPNAPEATSSSPEPMAGLEKVCSPVY